MRKTPVRYDRSDERSPYETFSSVSILLLDLAESLDDKPRHLAMAIYQFSELGLLLVERWLENEMATAMA